MILAALSNSAIKKYFICTLITMIEYYSHLNLQIISTENCDILGNVFTLNISLTNVDVWNRSQIFKKLTDKPGGKAC